MIYTKYMLNFENPFSVEVGDAPDKL